MGGKRERKGGEEGGRERRGGEGEREEGKGEGRERRERGGLQGIRRVGSHHSHMYSSCPVG